MVSPKRPFRHSAENIAIIRKMWRTTCHISAIVEATGISTTQIHGIVQTHRIGRRPDEAKKPLFCAEDGLAQEQMATIVNLRMQGRSFGEISSITSVSEWLVRDVVVRRGVNHKRYINPKSTLPPLTSLSPPDTLT